MKTNKIYEQQTLIAEQSVIPKINVFRQAMLNSDETSIEREKIVIENYGGGLDSFNSSIRTFYDVEYFDDDTNETVKSEVAVQGYYDTNYSTNRATGTITTYTGYNNSKVYNDFSKSIIEYNSNKDKSIYMEQTSYIKVSYLDSLGREYCEYYRLKSGRGEKLDDKYGKEKFEKYDMDYKQNRFLRVSTQTVEQLNNLLDVK